MSITQQLELLYAGQSLQKNEASLLMSRMLDGDLPAPVFGALMACFRMRMIRPEELAGFRESVFERTLKVDLEAEGAIDMVGTGGDKRNTFNITTLAALTVAACGYRVIKHGNVSASASHGSSDILALAGFSFRQNREDLLRQLEAANITFLHAPLFHPGLAAVAKMRKELGVATLFNLLGPLLNPASPSIALFGVADARMQDVYSQLADRWFERHDIVHAMDDYDEATLSGPVRCYGSEGRRSYHPRDFGCAPTRPEEILVGEKPLEQFLSIMSGKGSAAQTNTVAINAALGIKMLSGKSLQHAVEEARETLLYGAVKRNFDKLLGA